MPPFAYTDTVTVYKPNQLISDDLSVLPKPVTLVGTIMGNMHRGTEKSRSTVNNLGIMNVTTGYFYTSIDNFASVGDRYVLASAIRDTSGTLLVTQYWVIHGIPAYRNRFAATAHLRAVITLLKIKPSGIP